LACYAAATAAFLAGVDSVVPVRADEPAVTAVRATEVHVGDGRVIRNGVIVIRNGRIVAAGADIDIPDEARVIEVQGGAVTPGLIDANASIEPSDLLAPASRRRPRSAPEPDFARVSPREALHRFFCPTHGHEPVVGCCGSACSRALAHVSGEKCDECGFPDSDPGLAAGTRPGEVLAEESSEVIPHTRVIDTVNLRSPDFDRLLAGGVTTVFVSPDSAAVISSQGAIVRTGGTSPNRVLREADAIKAAMGTDPSWLGGRNSLPFRERVSFRTRRPTTRMGVTWVFRKALYDTRAHANGLPLHGADVPSEPALETLGRLLRGEIPLRIQARTQHDITTAIRLADEFDLSFTLEEATEAYLCLDELKARRIPVVFGPVFVDAPGRRARSAEVDRARLHTMQLLLDAGIETALTAHELRDEDGLARQAMYAMRYGVSLAEVTKAVTSTPARLLGLEDELGTLEAGKRADLLIWSEAPFASTSRPVVVMIDGQIVRDLRKDRT
jgi:imidazolonepropionase-like amidohydrolase